MNATEKAAQRSQRTRGKAAVAWAGVAAPTVLSSVGAGIVLGLGFGILAAGVVMLVENYVDRRWGAKA